MNYQITIVRKEPNPNFEEELKVWQERDEFYNRHDIGLPSPQPEIIKNALVCELTEEQFAAEVRFLAAAKLFELGKLSSGKAAAMAGLGRVEFLHKLGAYGFYAINLHDEQIAAELNAAAELTP